MDRQKGRENRRRSSPSTVKRRTGMAELRSPPAPVPQAARRKCSKCQPKRKTRPGGQPDGSSHMGAWGGWALAPNTASMGRDYRSHRYWSRHGRRTFKPPAIFLGLFWRALRYGSMRRPGLRRHRRETDNLLALQSAQKTGHLILRHRVAAKLQAKHPALRLDDRGLIAVEQRGDIGDARLRGEPHQRALRFRTQRPGDGFVHAQ